MKIAISEVEIDDQFYPRNTPNWLTIQSYTGALELGAHFPPIVVAPYSGHYVLLDGRHRLEAHKRRKLDKIEADVRAKLKPKDFLLVAAQLNVSNGLPLSVHEKLTVAHKLIEAGMTRDKVSKAILMPVTTMRKLLVERTVRTPLGGSFIAKKALLSKKPVSDDQQSTISVGSQLHLLTQLLQLLQNGLVDTENESVMSSLMSIRDQLNKLLPAA